MRRGIVVFAVCTLLVGCTTRYQRARNVTIAAGALTVVSLVAAGMGDDDGGIENIKYAGVPSLVVFLNGLLFMEITAKQDAADEKRRVEAERAAQRNAKRNAKLATRERLWSLTKDAATHARSGNCPQVAMLDREVSASDEEFHAVVFARDIAIARCLGAAR